MMSRYFQIIFLILSIAAIFITVIPLGRYLSNQYFELRKELNSDGFRLKYSSQENMSPAAAKVVSQKKDQNAVFSHENIEGTESFQLRSTSPDAKYGSLKTPVRVKRRSKRRAQQLNKELISWHFNLNVTRYPNHTSQKTSEDEPNAPLQNQNLEVAVHARGKEQTQKAFNDLHNALMSVQSFVKSVFENAADNGTRQELELRKSPFLSFDIGTSESKKDAAIKIASESYEETPLPQKQRKGKFLLDFLGFGKSIETTQSVEVTQTEENNLNFKNTEIINSLKTDFLTEDSKTMNLNSDSLGLETNVPSVVEGLNKSELNFQGTTEDIECSDCDNFEFPDTANEVETKTLASFEELNSPQHNIESTTEYIECSDCESFEFLDNVNEMKKEISTTLGGGGDNPQQDFGGPIEHIECSDCESFNFSNTANEIKEVAISASSETVHTTTSSFSDDVLNTFCMSLVNKVGESQHLTDEGNDFDPESNTLRENQVRSSQNHSLLDLVNLFSSLREKELNQKSTIIEDSLLANDVSPSHTTASRQSRFLNFNNLFGLGSGRSAVGDEFNDLMPGVSDENNIDFENLPSILDCEDYFRRKQNIKMFPKPNLMDMMSDPKIQLVDFANETISTKLKEQNLQFLTDLLKTGLNNSVETFDNLDDTIERPETVKENTSSGKETNFVTNEEKFESENEEILSETESDIDLNKLMDASTNSDKDLNHSQRDARFIPLFGFGSGSNENPRSGWFLNFFGSGERKIEADVATESVRIEEFGSGAAFQVNTVFSHSNAGMVHDSEDLDLGTASVEDSRFLGLFGLGGSGGRELSESVELVQSELTTYIENGCMGDCSEEVPETFPQSNNCSDCSFETPRNTPDAYFTEDIAKNENECDDCYLPSIKGDNSDNKFSESDVNSELNFDGNLTKEHLHENSGNCSCSESSDGKDNRFDCDECTRDVLEIPDNLNEVTDVSQSNEAVLKQASETKSVHGNNCVDCDQEGDMQITEKVNSEKEVSFSLCEDCSSQEFNELADTFDVKDENDSVTVSSKDIDKLNFVNELNDDEDARNQSTTEIHKRFLGPIFLTGSGDGNLFGDNDDPINLIEEESAIKPDISIRKRGRSHDIDELCEDCNEDFSEIRKDPTEFEQIQPIERHLNRSPKLIDANLNAMETTVSSKTFPNVQSFTDVSITSTVSKIQPQSCTSARECNSTLNERCVTIEGSSVCGCERAFVRHKETSICVVKRVVEAVLQLPGEKFDKDLENPSSPRYKQMSKSVVDTVWFIFKDKPELLSIIAEVELEGFREGSVIVSFNIVFAMERESEEKLIKVAESELQEALKDENFMQNAALDISNASVLSFVSEPNPCESSELNYCSEHAYCYRNNAFQGRFTCSCKDHYKDVSSNSLFPGERCIAKCPPDYCGPNGHCETFANDEINCLCNGTYFGKRCEIPGMVVFIVLAAVALISMVIAVMVAFRKRFTRRSYGSPQEFRRSEETGMNMRGVSDAIALEENIGSQVTKFVNIQSTPIQDLPVIKVTRPSAAESLSFECDSTFNVTPTSTPTTAEISEQNTSTT